MLAVTRSGTWIADYWRLICVTGILCVVTELAETIKKFLIVTGIHVLILKCHCKFIWEGALKDSFPETNTFSQVNF